MACDLVSLTSAVECSASDGGIYQTYLVDKDEITDVTFDASGIITGFTMAQVGQWVKYEYDDDDTAFFNQTGERTNKKHTVNGQAFFKFAGISATKVEFANKAKNCCGMVAIHFLNSGAVLVQGIDYDWDATTWKFTKQRAKVTASILTDTGANEDRVEVNINSVGKEFASTTSLTATAIEAL